MLFSIIDNQVFFTFSLYSLCQGNVLCTLRGLALAKNRCNNMNNSRAGIARLCFFLMTMDEYVTRTWKELHIKCILKFSLQNNKYT